MYDLHKSTATKFHFGKLFSGAWHKGATVDNAQVLKEHRQMEKETTGKPIHKKKPLRALWFLHVKVLFSGMCGKGCQECGTSYHEAWIAGICGKSL
jgi:hypothetical protein